MMHFKFRNGSFEFPKGRCILFGILNITPDSFSDGGKFLSTKLALEHALQLEKDGADVIDVGGESTRPGAHPISAAQEMKRILPVIQALKKHLRIPISVDTTKAKVAELALHEGVNIINDISGLVADPQMASVIASSKAGLILMHSRGTPSTMQTRCNYQNVLQEVKDKLFERYQFALSQGISGNQIALDPGIGFSKTSEQNLVLLKNLKKFTTKTTSLISVDRPIMIGVSRKSFLGGEIVDRTPSTLTSEIWAYQQGIHMIRTHDVGATRRAIATLQKIQSVDS